MIHILLIILKIIGIILLIFIGLILLTLLFPLTYKAKGSFHEKQYNIKVSLGWLFHLIHFSLVTDNDDTKIRIRILGIPIKIPDIKSGSKEKMSKEKPPKSKAKVVKSENGKNDIIIPDESADITGVEQKENTSDKNEIKNYNKTDSNDQTRPKSFWIYLKNFFFKIKEFVLKTIQRIKNILNDLKGSYKKALEIKNFISSNTTKEAYRFAKKYLKKVIKHVFPRKIRANIHYGFGEPDITGKSLGYIAMAASALNVNMRKIVIEPDFDKKIIEGSIKIKGHIITGVLLYYFLRIYFKKEIHDIIKKYI